MQYKRAFLGIKKIHLAEQISLGLKLISALFLLLTLIEPLSGLHSHPVYELLGLIFSLCALLWKLVGISQALFDEEDFKFAHAAMLLAFGFAVATPFLEEDSLLGFILEIAGNIPAILVSLFIIRAIRTLARKRNAPEVLERGRRLYALVLTVALSELALDLAVSFLPESVGGFWITVLSLAVLALSCGELLLLLGYTGMAEKMLHHAHGAAVSPQGGTPAGH